MYFTFYLFTFLLFYLFTFLPFYLSKVGTDVTTEILVGELDLLCLFE